jgi:cell division protein FtsW (lipid II flippase)
MSNLKKDFLSQVNDQIRASEVKEKISRELNYHLESEKQRLVQRGMNDVEAEERAIKQMGSPVQLGQHFNKIHRPKLDWWLIGLLLITFGFSFLPLLFWNIGSAHFPKMKIIYTLICFGIIIGLMLFDFRKLLRWKWLFYGTGICVLLLPLLVPSAYVNGVPVFMLGPMDIESTKALPFLYLGFSAFLISKKARIWKIGMLLVFPLFLLMITPDLTSIFILSLMVFVMLWYSTLDKKKLLKLFIGGMGVFLTGGFLIWNNIDVYQKERISGFLNPQKYPKTSGYMYLRVREFLNEAGWFGQAGKKDFIPSGHTDFVFVSLTYNFGWILAISLVVVLFLLMTRMILVSMKVKDEFGKMLIVGGVALFSIQFLYNIGMTLGILPFIGISLPFISYGLTPTLINSIGVGIVLSVYRRKDLVIPSESYS